MAPVLGGSTHDDEEQACALGRQRHRGSALLVATHVAVVGLAVAGVGYEAIAPAGLVDINLAITRCAGDATEVGLHHRSFGSGVEVDDVIAVVLRAVGGIDAPQALAGLCEVALVLSDAMAGTLADAVDIPCGHAGKAFVELIAKLFLRQLVQSLVGLHGVFGLDRLAPQPTDEVLAMLHAPVVLHEAVLVAPVLVQDVQMALRQMSFEVLAVGELSFGINLVGLPVGAALPPAVATRRSGAIAVVVAVALTEVGRHQILERMSNFMSHRVTAAGADGTGTHVAYARLLVNTRGVGTPVGLIEHVELNLILVGGGMAWLQESQLVDIAVPYLLGILQHRFRVEAIAARRLRGIGAEPFLPENHEMLALHGTAEAPLAVLAHVVVRGIGAGMPEDASWVGKHQRALEGGVAEQRLQPVFGIALRERGVEEVHHGGSARAVVHAERH